MFSGFTFDPWAIDEKESPHYGVFSELACTVIPDDVETKEAPQHRQPDATPLRIHTTVVEVLREDEAALLRNIKHRCIVKSILMDHKHTDNALEKRLSSIVTACVDQARSVLGATGMSISLKGPVL